MTTSTNNTFVDQTTDANFQQWINEIYTAWVTTCGLTQTADTGQMTVPCTSAHPVGTSTQVGYYVFRFNDTLQATAPVFIRIDFGSGATAANAPQMWITIGTSTNGAGTMTGTVFLKSTLGWGNFTGDTINNRPSYYCYNATQGFLFMGFKYGNVSAQCALCGCAVFRTVNNSGAPTGDGLMVLCNNLNTTSGSSTTGAMGGMNFNQGQVYQTVLPLTNPNGWGYFPYATTSSLRGTSGQIFPVFQWKGSATVPGHGITNALALSINAEIPAFSTFTCTVLGSTSLTYLAAGAIHGFSSLGQNSYSSSNFSLDVLFQ